MPIVYKLVNPLTKEPYYVGYTVRPLIERFMQHLASPKQKTTIELLNVDILPVIEIIVEGETVDKSTELYWIQKVAKYYKLENTDGLVNYQNRKHLFELSENVINGIEMSEEDRRKIALELLIAEMPRHPSVPIMIRIANILKWATGKKDLWDAIL